MASAPGVATHPLPTGQRLIVTVGVMMAVLLQVLDTTIANVALPHMQASLSATQDSINWVLTSYIVASAIALPISGWLADKVGRKRLLLISVVVFTVASVLCATATSLTEMVLFRALQGVGGAFIVPLAQATLFDINPREKHGQAMALFGGGVMIGPILGTGARRMADRQLQLALGVPRQPSGRRDLPAADAPLHAQDRDA